VAKSKAYREFIDALKQPESLLSIESRYSDPAPPPKRKAAEALRGGAAVLMVAAFENYLKDLVEEHIDELTHMPPRFKIENIPEEMVFSNLCKGQQHVAHNWRRHLRVDALRDSGIRVGSSRVICVGLVRYLCNMLLPLTVFSNLEYLVTAATRKKKGVKVIAYNDMAKTIVSGVMSSPSFTEAVRSNPNADKLKEMFKRLGIKECFQIIKPDFDSLWGAATADTFISDYLDSILQRRHTVAHTASALNISRQDLQESLRFIKILGEVCDTHLARHIGQILNK